MWFITSSYHFATVANCAIQNNERKVVEKVTWLEDEHEFDRGCNALYRSVGWIWIGFDLFLMMWPTSLEWRIWTWDGYYEIMNYSMDVHVEKLADWESDKSWIYVRPMTRSKVTTLIPTFEKQQVMRVQRRILLTSCFSSLNSHRNRCRNSLDSFGCMEG